MRPYTLLTPHDRALGGCPIKKQTIERKAAESISRLTQPPPFLRSSDGEMNSGDARGPERVKIAQNAHALQKWRDFRR